MTPAEIEQIRARHSQGPNGCLYCEAPDNPVPCDASLLLAALSEAEAERDMLKKRPWVAGLEQHRARLAEAEAELARHHQDFARWEEMAAKGAGLSARLEAVEGALREIADFDPPWDTWDVWRLYQALKDIARAALAQEHTEPQEQT